MLIKKRRNYLFFEVMIIIAFINFNAFTQELPRVAITTFAIINGSVSFNEADVVTELFTAKLVTSDKVNIVNRHISDRVITEMRLEPADWKCKEKTTEIGNLLNADILIKGQFMKMDEKIYWSVTMIDLESAEKLCFHIKRINRIDRAPLNLKRLSSRVLGEIRIRNNRRVR